MVRNHTPLTLTRADTTDMSLLDYEKRFSQLNPNRAQGRTSPHKIAMLLAVMELIENEVITENCIHFNSALTEAFTRQFSVLATDADRDDPHHPFFHLQSEGFWKIQLLPGKADSWRKLSTASSANVIRDHVECAHLDDELFELLKNFVVRELLKAALYQNLTITDAYRRSTLEVNGWDWLECEACVADYFEMLNKDLINQPYNKTAHRKLLAEKLNSRSNGSIEFKHQNISAILVEMGFPYIPGYKPRFNYQSQLREVVLAHIAANQDKIDSFASGISYTERPSYLSDWDNVLDNELPERIPVVARPPRKYLARICNYPQLEAANRQLGASGEKFVIAFEKHMLNQLGRNDLADEIEWSSNVRGDGLGFDVRSFRVEARTDRVEEHFIEVKTTNNGKYQPFYVTPNELDFSRDSSENYSLYRVFELKKRGRIFRLPGAIDQHVSLQAELYKASFHQS